MFNSKINTYRFLLRTALILVAPLFISSCYLEGGDDPGSASSLTTNPSGSNPSGGGATTSISGTATKGPITSATVTVYLVNAVTAALGDVIGTGTTDADGNFNVPLSTSPEGPVAVVIKGGSYISEVDSGTTVTSTSPACAMVASFTPGLSGLSVTPLSDMVCAVAESTGSIKGSAATAIGDANALIMGVYGLTSSPDTIKPDFSSGGVSSGSDGGKLALVLAALDKLASDLVGSGKLPSGSRDDLYKALSDDISDGKFDGLKGSDVVPLGTGALPFTAGSTDFIGALSSIPSSVFGGADTSAEVSKIASGVGTVAPPSVGISATSSGAMSTLASGGHQYLFVAARQKGVQKVDITDPANPVVLGPTDGWNGADLVNNFSTGNVGGAQVITGLAAGAQVLVFSYSANHIALVNPDTGAVTYEGDTSVSGSTGFSGGSAYIAGAIPVAGSGAWLATTDGYQFLDANATIAGAADPVVTTSYDLFSGQQLAENMGGDISHGYLFAPNYSGIQLVNVAEASNGLPVLGSFGLDPAYTSSFSLNNFDGGSVDSGYKVGILTYEDTSNALFIDMSKIAADTDTKLFTPGATNGLAEVTFATSSYVALSGSAVDPVTHQALLMAGYSNDLVVAQLQNPASVAEGDSWMGASNWVNYTFMSAYNYATDPHAVAVINNSGKSYGYLLNGSSNPVGIEQIDMGGLLGMARAGTTGDDAHKPGSDPTVSGGPIMAIDFLP